MGNESKKNSPDSKEEKGLVEKLSEQVKKLAQKTEKLENENAVLTNKVDAVGDPNEKPRTIKRGYVKPDVKFQKNNNKIKATL